MGVHIKSIIEEGLIVSAQDTKLNKVDLINAKSDFTKFYKEAYFYKLISDLPEQRNINFLNDTKKQFDIYFKNLFPNTKKNESIFISPNFMGSDFNPKEIKIDYKKPDKLIKKGLPNPITQLMLCASTGDYECVKELVDAGANVNLLKSSDNASALLLALPSNIICPLNKEAIKISKLLIPLMSEEALNTKLIKKQESALSLAISQGLVEIVKQLILHNVDLNLKTTLDEQTALYLTLQYISLSKRDSIIPSNNTFELNDPLKSKREIEKLAKVNNLSSAIFDKDREEETVKLHQNMRNPKKESHKEIYKELDETIMKNYQKNIRNYFE